VTYERAKRIVPIPGTTKLARLEENLGAVVVELTSDDLREINVAASKIAVKGERLPEAALKMTGLYTVGTTNAVRTASGTASARQGDC
jgi:diketogulonate reductase-like aldo/keto reductase